MEKRRRKMVGRLDTSNPKPKWHKTIYLDGDVIRETTHDGNFSPTPPTPPTPTADYLYFEAAEANSTVSMISSLATAPDLEYSTDGETWQEWQHTTTTEDDVTLHIFDTLTLSAIGDKVYLRGINPEGFGRVSYTGLSAFLLTGQINAGGSVTSIIDGDGVSLTEIPPYGFCYLFSDQMEDGALLTAPTLGNATTIGEHGLDTMFIECAGLTSAMSMTRVVSIGYYGCNGMYEKCENLTTAAPMTSLTTIGYYGCSSMYKRTGVTSAASTPVLTTIGDYGCYGMYAECHSLTTAADMPLLTTIEEGGCYIMYSETRVTAAASMPSLITIGYMGCTSMYVGCSYLTSSADMPSLESVGYMGCAGMYAETAITSAADMPSLNSIGEGALLSMYGSCTFDMSDDGTTLNFDFPTLPITTTGDNQKTFTYAYEVAEWMGNTNGFTNP